MLCHVNGGVTKSAFVRNASPDDLEDIGESRNHACTSLLKLHAQRE